MQVVSIMLKKNLKDPEGQMVEDALCLGGCFQHFSFCFLLLGGQL